VPGAADDLAVAVVAVEAGAVGLNQAELLALAQAAALVRAAVEQREIFALHVEHHHVAPAHGYELALAGRDLVRPGDHETLHQRR
jgi:hypothetical protein